MKTYTLKLTTEQAELLDVAMSLAVKHAAHAPDKQRELRKEIIRQFEAQD